MINGRKVITLFGSTDFEDEFHRLNREKTLEGNVVFSVGVFLHRKNEKISELQKMELDAIHKCKIDLSDEIFVINKNGKIGASTTSETLHARRTGKPRTYLEPFDEASLPLL